LRRTKIVCTIGPASEDRGTIASLLEHGMDVARLNFSHGKIEDHLQRINLLRLVSREMGKRVGILVDTRGPEVRIKTFARNEEQLKEGDLFTLTTEDVPGDRSRVSVNYKGLPGDLLPGAHILVDDGLIELRVEKTTPVEVQTVVLYGGVISSRKSINLPGISVRLPSLSPGDIRDIEFALEHDVDFIAASFVRRAGDIIAIKRLVEKHNKDVKVIAKIENYEGIENFKEILEVADGIMVARGDLGVEIPIEDVPQVQKRFISACNRAGKPVITATQMLDSMIRHPRPTRAEASDVANAIFDGTDAVMLSGETAVGAFPVETLKIMSRIACRTEEGLEYRKMLDYYQQDTRKTTTDAISYATCRAAFDLNAAVIISATQSGHTARMVSKFKPKAPIIAVTPSEKVASALTLTWGVYPLLAPPSDHSEEIFNTAVRAALDAGLIKGGELVILTAGVPVGVPGTTNFMRIDTVGEVLVRGQGVGKYSVTAPVHVALTLPQALEIRKGEILVTPSTGKEYLPAMEKAAAIITETGGLTSHAAIVGLELGVPVIVGAEGATGILAAGQLVTVDAVRGLVYRGRATVF